MARPNTTNLVVNVPQFSSPVTGVGVCGTSYNRSVDVRSPYQQIDRYGVTLQPVMSQAPTTAASLVSIALTIASAQAMIDGEDTQVRVRLKLGGLPQDEGAVWSITDAANRNAIQDLIDRAKFYLGWARALWDYWANDWRPKVVGFTKRAGGRPPNLRTIERGLTVRWPLSAMSVNQISQPGWANPYGQRCFAAIQASPTGVTPTITMDDTPSQDWEIRVQCPTSEEITQHASDRQLFRDLAEAALLWARCAQEAAAAVGIYHRNRRDVVLNPPPSNSFAPLPPAPPVSIVEGIGPLPPTLPPPPIPDPNELEGVTFPKTTRAARKQPVPWGKVALGAAGVYTVWRLLVR